MELRTALAAVLGVGLGLLFLAYPEFVVRAQTAGRLPHDRGGGYGEEAEPSARWRRLVQLLGLVGIALGCYFAVRALA